MLSSTELLPNIKAFGLTLWLEKEKTLIFSDVHLGYEEAMQKQGILMPPFQFPHIMEKMKGILSQVKPETIIVNGDLKHEFGAISKQEWREVIEFLTLLEKNCDQIILIRGNHDKILGPIAQKKKISIQEEGFAIGQYYITHGDRIPNSAELKKAKTIIIGNEHPAISLREKGVSEKFKCFLVGKWNRKNLIVLPSLCLVTEGTDILTEQKLLSPYLDQDLSNFKAFAVADEIYDFGKIKDLRKRY